MVPTGFVPSMSAVPSKAVRVTTSVSREPWERGWA